MPVGGSRLWKIRGSFSRKTKPWARLLDVQGFQKSRAYFSLEKHTSVEHARVQGFQKIQNRFFSGKKKHGLEHACWTSRASRKSNSAKVIFYCKANKTIFTKQLSCAAQITQGAYTDVAFWFHPKRLSLRTQGKTLTLILFWERRNPYTPSQRRFSNGLAYNRSKVQYAF